MFLHTAHLDGAARAEQFCKEADLQRALADARLGSSVRRTAARWLRAAAVALTRTADRLATQHPAPATHPASARRRSPTANA
ncbi:MAG: hypothetical protein P1P87_12360 [Trueperaceae bacterium]|nr:hypothetical protein [Trueperaceae bacterium]